jgi:hypothetical protein
LLFIGSFIFSLYIQDTIGINIKRDFPPGTPPAGNALGTPSWRGGWTVAGEYGPELLNLPGGTSIYDAPTTQRARRSARPVVVNQTFVVNDKLMAERAAQRAVQLIKSGGR